MVSLPDVAIVLRVVSALWLATGIVRVIKIAIAVRAPRQELLTASNPSSGSR
jgi:hypothetical protein